MHIDYNFFLCASDDAVSRDGAASRSWLLRLAPVQFVLATMFETVRPVHQGVQRRH